MLRDVDLATSLPREEPHQHEVDEGFTRWTHDLSRLSHHVLTLGAAALFIIPLVWMVGASLRMPGLPPPSSLEWLPNPAVLDNYPRLLKILPQFDDYLFNSLKVVAIAVPLTIVTASWAGFAIAQLAPRPRNLLIVISLATLMVPVTALWITRFIIYKNLGVLDTLWAVILPSFMGTSPFYVLLFYWAFTRVPRELFEAAQLEGAGAFRVWASIGIPLVKPAITAVGVLSFVFYWSNFMDPLLYLNNQENYTLPIALQSLQQMAQTDFPLLMAGAVVITIPVIVMFMFAQRYFLSDAHGQGWLGGGYDSHDGRDNHDTNDRHDRPSRFFRRFTRRVPQQVVPTNTFSLYRVSLRLPKRAAIYLRLFLACNLFVVLTMTIMQREDHDGYQATHLFFMPRENWEMDEGRGMLYEEEYYRDVDIELLAEEWNAEYESAWEREPDGGEALAAGTRRSYEDEYEYDDYEYEEHGGYSAGDEGDSASAASGPTVRRTPREGNYRDNDIPVSAALLLTESGAAILLSRERRSIAPIAWQGDVPTPPPRRRTPDS